MQHIKIEYRKSKRIVRKYGKGEIKDLLMFHKDGSVTEYKVLGAKMYDTKKKCSVCDWSNVYDSKDDWRKMAEKTVCPKCGKPLLTVPYKPIT